MLKNIWHKYLYLILFFIIANSLYFLANIPFISRIQSVTAGNIPTYQHHGVVMDYLNYITFIRESAGGAWRLPDLHTTEPTSKNGNMFYFILLGKLSKITGLSPTATYHLTRIVEFQIFVFILFVFLVLLLGKSAGFWAAILSIITSPPYSLFGKTIYGRGDLGIPAWWMLTPYRRVDMIPPHAASIILLLLEILFIARIMKACPFKNALIAGILAFFSTMFHPASGLFFIFAHALVLVLIYLKQLLRKKHPPVSPYVYLLIPALFSGLAILFQRYEVTSTYPFNQWLYFDVIWYDRYEYYVRDFFIGGGPILVFGGFLALVTLLASDNPVWLLISVWALLTYAIMPISTQLGVAKFRLALLLPYIPLSVLYTKWIKECWRRKKQSPFLIAIAITTIIILSGVTLPSMPVMYKDWAMQAGNIEPGMSYSHNWADAINFLSNHIPPYSYILSGEINGILIPSRVRAVVYVGQYLETIDFEAKKELVRLFFGGLLSDTEARKLIYKNRIKYIFYGNQEKSWGPGPKAYSLSTSIVFQNPEVTIYEVK
ncbi:hypothetical protein A2154_01730 [Candidatus Gottesmanbacteria bacterium RBG_16_43_7]|uniref:Glycosyltransferase RgtA/B/C/D-like domain-containing protein n=1 Tax=Candidatus Gottesmanbacteria bacterium RBG_16_43_7 TaxID=1798373 RepID=A0A1F5Z8E6_9BACT|nr:MAG: hypothetical protein A2154_01730 [Candidatus Gottesmanbacteria bacterium RBG_16_43_7]